MMRAIPVPLMETGATSREDPQPKFWSATSTSPFATPSWKEPSVKRGWPCMQWGVMSSIW